MQPIRMALVGHGRWGRFYREALAEFSEAELYCVVDPNPAAWPFSGPAPRRYATLAEALADPLVEAVIVNSPSPQHHAHSLAALRAGKHILVEKPVSLTLAEAQLLAQQAGSLVYMPAHIVRFFPSMQTARALIRDGAIGSALKIIERRVGTDPNFPAPPAWWNSLPAFLIYHFGSHTLDAALWILDDKPRRVFARGQARQLDPGNGAVDDFSLILETERGAVITLEQCLAGERRLHDWLIHGERGQLTIENYSRLTLNGHDQPLAAGDLNRLGLAAELAEFVAAIRQNRPPLVTGRDILPTMALLEAARQSLQSGRAERVPPWEA